MSILSTFLQANIEEKTDGVSIGKYDWKFSKNAVFEIVESGHHRDRWFEISNFKMPVLVVRGENSHVLKQQTYEKMLTVNPNITGLEIAGAGHWVHYEKHDEFVNALKGFFSSHQ